jgi:hypothetical protein
MLHADHTFVTIAPSDQTHNSLGCRTHNMLRQPSRYPSLTFLRRYYANWTAPRPESFREDAELARNVTGTDSPSNPQAAQLYLDLASGAESGWDYSSRWFADNKTQATIRTTQVGSTVVVMPHGAHGPCNPVQALKGGDATSEWDKFCDSFMNRDPS